MKIPSEDNHKYWDDVKSGYDSSKHMPKKKKSPIYGIVIFIIVFIFIALVGSAKAEPVVGSSTGYYGTCSLYSSMVKVRGQLIRERAVTDLPYDCEEHVVRYESIEGIINYADSVTLRFWIVKLTNNRYTFIIENVAQYRQ